MNDVELRESNERVCDRCFARTNHKRLIQVMNYLGATTRRFDLCEDCFKSFVGWFGQSFELNKVAEE